MSIVMYVCNHHSSYIYIYIYILFIYHILFISRLVSMMMSSSFKSFFYTSALPILWWASWVLSVMSNRPPSLHSAVRFIVQGQHWNTRFCQKEKEEKKPKTQVLIILVSTYWLIGLLLESNFLVSLYRAKYFEWELHLSKF